MGSRDKLMLQVMKPREGDKGRNHDADWMEMAAVVGWSRFAASEGNATGEGYVRRQCSTQRTATIAPRHSATPA